MTDNEIVTSEMIIDALKSLAFSSRNSAKKAHDAIFGDDERKELLCCMYLNDAISNMVGAKAIYYSKLESLEHHDIEEMFNRFNEFSREVFTNISTEHSHQWSDIEYRHFVDAYENSVLFLGSLDEA